MKITVLEHPRVASERRFNDIANTPLWSCLMGGYAAASLERAGFDTLFLDDARPGVTFDETAVRVEAHDPDLLCINAVYFWEHTCMLFDFIAGLKARGFSGHINLFGFFPTLIYREILNGCKAVDTIAVGEFENSLIELAAALKKSGTSRQIEGIANRSCLLDSTNRMRRPAKAPDDFAFPKHSIFSGTLSILASRGCYNHCSFCPVPSFYNGGSLWRGRSPANVAQEMETLVEKGARSFYFCDPNFIGPGRRGKQRTLELMERIRPFNIRFGMETRPQDLDEEILSALIDAGFESLLMGVESGSPDVLGQIDKCSGPDRAASAISLCRRFGIEPEIGFLMFVPDSRLQNLRENVNFLSKNRLLDRLERTANLLSHTQIMLAGTPGYQRFKAQRKLRKTGIFGFEADAVFDDPAVARVADLLTHACHTVLRWMSEETSPIYWQKAEGPVHAAVNDALVTLAEELIDQADCADDPAAYCPDTEKKAIQDRLFSFM